MFNFPKMAQNIQNSLKIETFDNISQNKQIENWAILRQNIDSNEQNSTN